MGKWMNSNNRCKVTDQTFAAKICQRYTFDGKKEIPYSMQISTVMQISRVILTKTGTACFKNF